ARVVEVEVGHHHVGHRGRVDPAGGELLHDAVVVVDAVDLPLLLRKLVAVAGLDQHPEAGPIDEQTVGGVLTPVLLVARGELGPDALGHDAVHGATVQPEAAAVDQGEREIAEAHPSIYAAWKQRCKRGGREASASGPARASGAPL